MTEQEAIEKIHSVYPTGCKNGLENMRALMAKLGNPQERLTMVHVAGTNGKGSCCAMTERVLRAAGYKTGLYTSPYIEVYNERIRLNGEPIAGEKLAALVESVWPAVEECEKEGVHVTEFELGTALAFCCFEKEKVDIAVIEVGLGGRLDPTNIIRPCRQRHYRSGHGSHAAAWRYDRTDCAGKSGYHEARRARRAGQAGKGRARPCCWRRRRGWNCLSSN